MSAYAHGQEKSASFGSSTSAQATGLQAGDPSPLAKADQLYRTGKLAAAAQEYNSLLQAEPRSALAYAGLVRVYIKQRKPAEAYAAAAKSLELAPQLDAAHVAMGEAYFRQGKITEAEKEFTALVRAGTKDPRAHLGLSRVYKANSFFKHAKIAIDHAYSLDPGDPDIQRAWIGTLGLQDRIKALQAYLSGEAKDDPDVRRNLERYLLTLQDEAGQPNRPCRLAAKLTSMETKLDPLMYDPKRMRGYGLNVKLNGNASKLLLDTGASGIIVDRKIAEKAGIKRVAEQDIKGIGDSGAVAGYFGYADSIKIGDLEFQDCYVRVIEKNSVADVGGLIGADVFSSFLVDIDLPNAKLRLSELPARPDDSSAPAVLESRLSEAPRYHDRYIAPTMELFTPVLRFGHDLLIPTKVNDSAIKLFLIDTGAYRSSISPSAAREVTKLSTESNVSVKGISGSVKEVFRVTGLTLQFSHIRQKYEDITAFDTSSISDSDGTEVSGFMGFSVLGVLRIRIDYRDGLVDLEYDRNRFH
jgi:predicted aspartyl protease/Flp pilus assembly protein TadD